MLVRLKTPPGGAAAPAGAAGQSWVGSSGYRMVWVPAGSFDMGSPASEAERDSDEQRHRVTLTKGYWAGELEVTQALWKSVMGTDPVSERSAAYEGVSLVGGQLPVVSIDWCESVAFANALSKRDGLRPAYSGVESCSSTSSSSVTWDRSSDGYRLATEAEWERAARGGAQTKYVGTNELGSVCQYGNVGDATAKARWSDRTVAPCSDGAAALSPVGAYSANAYGLKDVVGNAWEWTWDWKADFGLAAVTDPAGPGSGSYRVIRGGSWYSYPQRARVAYRNNYGVDNRDNGLGLRLVRSSLVP
jgi:sulfatase modifying factor 1